MPTKIKVLSDQAINQIAAGEVIENAASCVKELVENAIDANAGSIIVEVNASPLQLIRIVDDGSGMGRDDALLSLERHATSKIFSFSDLLKVTSMGFRGEALASIAAISKMTIITANEEGGTRLTACGGKILHVEECARNIGTTIEIRSLFYNVPARKKFQKTDSRSLIDIVNMLTKLSLAHPTISFKFYSQSKEMLLSKEFETEDFLVRLEKRMKDVLGNNFLQEKAPLQVLDLECKIEGFIGLPSLTRYNRRGQFLFINKRAIYCQAAVHAIYDGYGPRLQTGKHPLFVLHLTLPEELVDVNVHPQKKEVRLLDEPRIKNLLRKGIANSLQSIDGATLAPSFDRVEFLQEEAPRSMSYAPFVFKEEKDLLESEIVFFDRNQSSFEHSIIGMYQSYLLLDGCLFPKAEHILGKKE
ncbi:MAG: DNA mismatch repair endonuclease MutL, partial [Simkaniaceae bacterium]|nr:DNA mismatch repair endonuclease MutL [Simkaniaceae bacterium]